MTGKQPLPQAETDDGQGLRPVDGPAAWFGPRMAGLAAEWTHHFTDSELAELDTAVEAVLIKELDVVDIRQEDFPLPALGPVLAQTRREVMHGRGFALLRGVPVDRYDRLRTAIAFFGIGAHLGEAVSQNARGHALGHVTDLGFDYTLPLTRGYQTSERLPYHSDASDIVGLLCLKRAKAGGLSSIVSSVTLFNEMLRQRPELALLLTQPVYRDRRGEISEGKQPWYATPVFNPHQGGVATTYVRSTIRKAQRFSEVPRITEQLVEALDLLDAMAESPQYHLDMEFNPGDIQLVNNHVILHSRTRYEDHEAPRDRRHLLRLWLGCPDGPPLPPAYQNYQNLTAAGRPNGIHMPGVKLNAPLDVEFGGPGQAAALRKSE